MMMDWNAKTPGLWDWDSPSFFGGGEAAAPSPTKSSISASIDSSPNAGVLASSIAFGAANPSSVRPQEPIGLKLGKRTYFEDVGAVSGGGEVKNQPSSSSASSSPAAAAAAAAAALAKRSRTPHQLLQIFRCQVDGCTADLAGAKEYHRKHKVCDVHSKCPRVMVAGQDLRFCQQCSRFHDLAAFDEKKRSCRKRLANHNARRRKPQQDSISFNSGRFSSPFYDDRRQMNLLFNRDPFGHMRPPSSSTWEDSYDFSCAKRSWSKSTKGGEGHLLFPGTNLSNPVSTHRPDLDRLLPFKVTTAEVLNQGLEASAVASDLAGAPDIRHALSLLSTDSWGSTEPGSTSQAHSVHRDQICTAHHATHVVNGASHYLHEELPLVQEVRLQPFAAHNNSSQFQEFQLFKAQYEGNFFDSNQIH